MADKEKILAKIEILLNETIYEPHTDEVLGRIKSLKELKSYIESMQDEPCNHCQGNNNKEECDALVFGHNCPIVKKPVSKELEEVARSYSNKLENVYGSIGEQTRKAFKAGAKWQEEKDNEEKVLTYKHGFNDCKEHIEEVLLSEVLPCFMHGGEADEVVAKLDEVLN